MAGSSALAIDLAQVFVSQLGEADPQARLDLGLQAATVGAAAVGIG